MRIGELAERAATTTRALRYYEARGLLTVRRDTSGYRIYDEQDYQVLRQIQTLQDCGFGLEEIRPFVECLQAGNPTGDSCPTSAEVYHRKLAELDDLMGQLEGVRTFIRTQLARTQLARTQLARTQLTESTADRPTPRCEFTPPPPMRRNGIGRIHPATTMGAHHDPH